jgi:Flp pilus assembly protein TadG
MMRGRHYERGTSLPETAVILVTLLLLMFGIIDFGRAMYTYAFVAQLARQGARYAIVRGSQCTVLSNCPNVTSAQINTYVQSLSDGATAVGGINGINATTIWSCPNDQTASETPGCTAAVTVAYNFNPIFPYIKIGTLAFSSTSKMVVSQ